MTKVTPAKKASNVKSKDLDGVKSKLLKKAKKNAVPASKKVPEVKSVFTTASGPIKPKTESLIPVKQPTRKGPPKKLPKTPIEKLVEKKPVKAVKKVVPEVKAPLSAQKALTKRSKEAVHAEAKKFITNSRGIRNRIKQAQDEGYKLKFIVIIE